MFIIFPTITFSSVVEGMNHNKVDCTKVVVVCYERIRLIKIRLIAVDVGDTAKDLGS